MIPAPVSLAVVLFSSDELSRIARSFSVNDKGSSLGSDVSERGDSVGLIGGVVSPACDPDTLSWLELIDNFGFL